MVIRKKYLSPLRYPGGKASLANKIKKIIAVNNIVGIEYAEPFAGGAGLALSLLNDKYVSHVYLNDLDSAVFAFWSCALEQTSELCKLILDTPVTIEQWHNKKDVLLHPKSYSFLELGFATFFLNRTNRSGILDGGVIGGLQQNGTYKIDCRYNKRDLILRLELLATQKDKISLTRFDAFDFLDNVINYNPSNCLIFLDPPYYEKGKKLYFNYFNDKEHLKLASVVQNELKRPWIVTYGDVPEINSMYSRCFKVRYQINYSVSKKQKGNEIMYYSDDLKIPSDIMCCV